MMLFVWGLPETGVLIFRSCDTLNALENLFQLIMRSLMVDNYTRDNLWLSQKMFMQSQLLFICKYINFPSL